MTPRERALLRGRDLTPQTEDEAAIKAAVKGGGAGVVLRVNFIVDQTTEPVSVRAEKTPAEVATLINSGRFVYGFSAGENIVWHLSKAETDGENADITFSDFDGRSIRSISNADWELATDQ